MIAALIQEAKSFQIRLDPTSGSVSNGGVASLSAVSHYRAFGNDYAIGVRAVSTLSGTGWSTRVDIPLHGLDTTPTPNATGSFLVELFGDVYAFGEDYYIVDTTSIEVTIDGTLVDTWTPGASSSALVGKQPSAIVMIGIPPEIAAGCTVPTTDEPFPGFTASAEVAGVGGYRWMADGAYPAFLPLDLIDPPGISCGAGANVLPTISVTDTWTCAVSAEAHVSHGSSTITSDYKSSWIIPIPKLPRRFRRIGNDYRAPVERFSLPRCRMHGLSRCTTWTPPSDPVVNKNESYEELIPERVYIASLVGKDPHPFEDALNDECPTLYHIEAGNSHQAFSGGVFVSSVGRVDVSEFTGADSPPTGRVPERDSTNMITRYWDLVVNPFGSHKMRFENWKVDGAPVLIEDYWRPGRATHNYSLAFPFEERLKTRSNILLDAIASCVSWHIAHVSPSARMLGAVRWQTIDIEPLELFVYTSAQEDLFTPEDCALTLGAQIVVNADPGETVVLIKVKLTSWELEPCNWPQIADQLKLDWVVTNIVSVKAYLKGIDGKVIEVAVTKDGWVDLPRGEATKYAGSYGIDNGMGVVTDTGLDLLPEGISADTMADALRAGAFQLLPSSTREELWIEVTVADDTVNATLEYPQLRRHDGRDPGLLWEDGHTAALIYPDNAFIRFGNEFWWDVLGGDLFVTPICVGKGFQTSEIDGLAWVNTWLLGKVPTDGLDARLASLHNAIEGDTREDAAFATAIVILPAPQWDRVQIAAMNLLQEIEPLALCPRRERDSDWQETGAFCMDAWSWCLDRQRHFAPGSREVEVIVDGVKVTAIETGWPAGYTVVEHHVPMENTETSIVRYRGDDVASDRPFDGFAFVHGVPAESFGGIANCHDPWNPFFRAFVQAGVIKVERTEGYRPPGSATFTVTEGPDDSDPGIAMNERRELWLVWTRAGETRIAVSYNDGESFEDLGVILPTSYFPRVRCGEWNKTVAAAFVYNAGTSGPGKIHVRYKGPGDSAFGAAVATTFDVEPVGFDISFAPSRSDSLILSAVKAGESDPTEWESNDEGASWTEL